MTQARPGIIWRALVLHFLFPLHIIAVLGLSDPVYATSTDRITVRITKGVKPEVLHYLALHGESESRLMLPKDTVADLVERHYGSADETLVKLTLEVNPWLLKTDGALIDRTDAVDINLPAGPRWDSGVSVTVPEFSNVGELAKIYTGYVGKETRGDIAKANGLSLQSLDNVRGGTELFIPYQALPVSIILKPEYRESADLIAKELMALDPEKVLLAEPEPEISLIALGDSAQTGDTSLSCTKQSDADSWPFDAKALQNIIDENRIVDSQKKRVSRTHPVVAIADTGIDPSDSRFTFWQNYNELLGIKNSDDDGNKFDDDVYGVDVALKDGDPTPDPKSKADIQEHGTFVGGLAMGGITNGKLLAPGMDRISLLPIKISGDPRGSADTITAEAILDAVRYANVRAQIVNMSFEKPSEWSGLRSDINNMSGTLFVVAAGNHGKDVEASAIYPAALGGSKSSNVLTVGTQDDAMGKDKKRLASFSNKSQYAVDLVAPGCDLESTVPNNSTRRSSGTSASAPLVAYTAALLYDAGLDEPSAIKQRIVGSTTPDLTLQGIVWSQGILDIVAALDLFKDRIRMRADNRLVRGILTNSAINFNGDAIKMSRILQLTPLDTEGKRIRLAYRTDKTFNFYEGLSDTKSISIRTADNKIETIPLSEIRSFVSRKFTP